MTTSTTVETPKKRLYWATMPFLNYVFSKGKMAVFKHHRYATDIPAEIEELDKEVAAGHPQIYVKADQPFLSDEMDDPLKALRNKFIAEYLAEQAKFTDPANDMGTSSQQQIRPQSTSDIASVAAGGDATQSAAKLVELTTKMAAAVTPTSKK